MEISQKDTDAGTQNNDIAEALRRIFARLDALEVTQNPPNQVNITDLRRSVFHTRCGIKDNICSMIIDFESDANVISSYVVEKLKLTCIKHNDFGELKVTKQCMISFSIGRYSDNVLCDVIPMQDCHIKLGRS